MKICIVLPAFCFGLEVVLLLFTTLKKSSNQIWTLSLEKKSSCIHNMLAYTIFCTVSQSPLAYAGAALPFSIGWDGVAYAGRRNKIQSYLIAWKLKSSFLNRFPFPVQLQSPGLMTILAGSKFFWLIETWHLSGQQKATGCQEGIMCSSLSRDCTHASICASMFLQQCLVVPSWAKWTQCVLSASLSAGGAEFSRTELDCLSARKRSMQRQTQAVTWMKGVL